MLRIPGVMRHEPRCKICSIPELAIPLTKDLLLKRKNWEEILAHYSPMYEQMGMRPISSNNLEKHKRHCCPSKQFALEHLSGPAKPSSPYLELPAELAKVLEVSRLGNEVKLVNEFAGLEILTRQQFSHTDHLWKEIKDGDGSIPASLHKALVSAQAELRTTLVEKFKMRAPDESRESIVVPILIQEVTNVIFAEILDPRSQQRIHASIQRAYEYALKEAKKIAKEGLVGDTVDGEFEEVP